MDNHEKSYENRVVDAITKWAAKHNIVVPAGLDSDGKPTTTLLGDSAHGPYPFKQQVVRKAKGTLDKRFRATFAASAMLLGSEVTSDNLDALITLAIAWGIAVGKDDVPGLLDAIASVPE